MDEGSGVSPGYWIICRAPGTFTGAGQGCSERTATTTAMWWLGQAAAPAQTGLLDNANLPMPRPGDHRLRVLSPSLLELVLINTKRPSAPVDSWDWVPVPVAQPMAVRLEVADPDLSEAKIIWEALDQEPVFGALDYTLTPVRVAQSG